MDTLPDNSSKFFSEEDQIRGISSGNVIIFQYIFQTNYRNLFVLAKKMLHDSELCRDILQDSFAWLWANRQEIHVHTSIGAYLWTIVRNKCINHLKKNAMVNRHLLELKFDLQENTGGEADLVDYWAMQKEIEQYVGQLPDQQRTIFQMSREKGLSHQKIAADLNISPRTVETHIYRTLKGLKQVLKKFLLFF